MDLRIVIALITGVIVKLVDDIHDMDILPSWKVPVESILILLFIYILYIEPDYSKIISFLFGTVGTVLVLTNSHILDIPIWKLIWFLSIPVFLYHAYHRNFLININVSFLLLLAVLFIIVVYSFIEDKLLVEEISKPKIVSRILYCILLLGTLLLSPIIKKILPFPLDKKIEWNMILGSFYLFSYSLTSVIIMMKFGSISMKEIIRYTSQLPFYYLKIVKGDHL